MDSKIIYLATEWGDWLLSGCMRLPTIGTSPCAHRDAATAQTGQL